MPQTGNYSPGISVFIAILGPKRDLFNLFQAVH
nr:MAG TPA: hypothetical protein [Caudoviricetes sp.]